MQLGVEQYLLKPITKNKLTKVLIELKEKIGGNCVIKIGNDMRYLEYLLDMEEQI